jgi:hypothetical protein
MKRTVIHHNGIHGLQNGSYTAEKPSGLHSYMNGDYMGTVDAVPEYQDQTCDVATVPRVCRQK